MSGAMSERKADSAGIELPQRNTDAQTFATGSAVSGQDEIETEATAARPLLRTSEDGNNDDIIDSEFLAKKNYDEDPMERLWLSKPFWKSRRILIPACVILIVVIAIAVPVSLLKSRVQPPKNKIYVDSYWKGFSNIEQYFAFGDSWTDTHFYAAGEQPSTKNPLGNPTFPGLTSSNGLNYVGYLATRYNHSFIKAYDLGWSGSTIDGHIDHPGGLDWLDFVHQLTDEFLKYYTTNDTGTPQPVGWSSETALFSTFFGINDVMVFNRSNPRLDEVFDTYESVIGRLYDASARNFLIMNIPPVDQSPSVTGSPPENQIGFDTFVDNINNDIAALVDHLRNKYKDITIFAYDVHTLFDRVMADPQSVPETAIYKNTKTACPAYARLEGGVSPTKDQLDQCNGLLPEEYLWLNALHVTWPVHDAMAAEIEKLLLAADP